MVVTRSNMENAIMQPFYKIVKQKFYKVIKDKNEDNEPHEVCYRELTLPKYWCRNNEFNDSLKGIYLSSGTLQRHPQGEQDMYVEFNMVKLPNIYNFTTKAGWKEFLKLHAIKPQAVLKFIPDPSEGRGATYLKVQCVVRQLYFKEYGCVEDI